MNSFLILIPEEVGLVLNAGLLLPGPRLPWAAWGRGASGNFRPDLGQQKVLKHRKRGEFLDALAASMASFSFLRVVEVLGGTFCT